jgi:general secretion pathway protein I
MEVLIALVVVTVMIVAIGSVMSTNARGVRSLESHVALMQTAQMVMATAIPPRKELAPGTLSGEVREFRWQIDIGPVGGDWVADGVDATWIPELIKVRVSAPSGAAVDLETVRLMRRPQR